MPRTVDPDRYARRREHILDAAFTCFSRDGFHRASVAVICREAGIGSGTFFHYFPSKVSALLAILEAGTQDTREWFIGQAGRTDAQAVVLDWVRHTATAATEQRLPGFVLAVGSVGSDPSVAVALHADAEAQRTGLTPWAEAAQRAGGVRTDVPASTLTSWVMLILDGFLASLAADPGFEAEEQRPVLVDAVERVLARHADQPGAGNP